LIIATNQLPSGIAGTPYVAALEATGGTPTYTWSITAGNLPAGVSLSPATGIISGTPTVSGNFSFNLTLADASNPSATRSSTATIAVAAPPLEIRASTLPSVTVGAAYSQTLAATGGVAPYTWSITSGKLPAGLTLGSSTGVISGTPTASGTAKFTVTVRDSERGAQTYSVVTSIVVVPIPLKIVTVALPSATGGVSYAQTLQASGGTPAYKWSIASGQLPAGLALTPTGAISGTPKASGVTTFTAAVSDSGSPVQTTSAPVSITVANTPLGIVTPAPGSAMVGATYSQTLHATGGAAPYSWSITSGGLPSGLTLASATGTISGTPTASGTSAFTATVTDSSSPVQSVSVATRVVVAPTRVTILASTLPPVMVGSPYSQTLQASGGTEPYSWSIISGSLPSGLALASSTGTISGTPSVSGTFSFTATATDSSNPTQTASVAKQVVITATPLAITPSTLPAVTVGAAFSNTLKATGGTVPYVWSITSGKLPRGLTLASSVGTISGVPTASGVSTFTATVTDGGSPAQATSATEVLVVAPTLLAITSSAFPAATVGTAYSQPLQASGGSAPYTWAIVAGHLPAGLNLSSSIEGITGVPTASGTSTFATAVTDSSSPAQVTSATTTIVVAPSAPPPTLAPPVTIPLPPLAITTSTLPSTSAGTIYSQTLQASGGTAPYRWSITSGQLPAGLSISSTGTISGAPTSSGSNSFTVSVSDSSSPVQTQSAILTLAAASAAASPLTITSSALPSGTSGTAYSQSLQASGGTPAYTWSITSGNLPAGLTLAATTGTISGTPTASGATSLTATVTDNSKPAQTRSAATSITVAAPQQAAGPGTSWYIRPDGGTRYSSNVAAGQCDGKADVAYSGSGTNQHCAFNDFRYLWDDNSGAVGQGVWVIAGGDTVIVRGCTALAGQQNPSNPGCRIGWDHSTGSGPDSSWCYAVGSYGCFNPPIPAGTASQHTRILGQNYAACNAAGATNPKLYESNLTQIFGGFSTFYTLNLENTSYVDVQCLEITSHNGACTNSGSPSSPRSCNASQPLDDYATSGILTNNATSNIALQDVYIHGFNSSGLFGPIGGPITMTRTFVGFNAFAGWNFDDGSSTPDAPGSSITASYVTMNWNGCYEEYPIVDQIPARVCYDTNSGGFGDSWSGQTTNLDSFTCDHCIDNYNTKDAFIGPHTFIGTLSVTNSESIGNMGQDWKWGGNTSPNNTTFINNLTVGNCNRMSQPMTGAPSTYNQYLTGFCRAAGNVVASVIPAGSTWVIANNTWVTYQPTTFDIACPVGRAPCASTVDVTNNIFLGYNNPSNPYGAETPALYYIEDPSITVVSSHNVEYGMRNGDCPASSGGNICLDPQFVNEPSQAWASEATLDNFNFSLTNASPAIGAGTTYSASPSTDYFGTATTNPPVIGAVVP